MFKNCNKLTSLDVSKFYTNEIKDMSYLFNGCSSLTSLSLPFNTELVENMKEMFKNCNNLKILEI